MVISNQRHIYVYIYIYIYVYIYIYIYIYIYSAFWPEKGEGKNYLLVDL